MSFNIETLRPKYQLLWGSSGKSNALAVAEGLRFDPMVLREAADIAQGRERLRLKPGDAGNKIRAQAMQVGPPGPISVTRHDVCAIKHVDVLKQAHITSFQKPPTFL